MITSARTLVLFALLATVPFLPTGMMLYRATQEQIETTQKEIKGIPLHKNLYALLAHRLGFAPAFDTSQALRENFEVLQAPPPFFLNPAADAAFRTEMESLFTPAQKSAPEPEKVLRFMRKVGDSSTLILDPELATYYLVDILVNIIPASLASLEGPGTIPQSDEAIFRAHAELAHLQNSLQWALARIEEGAATPGQKESVSSLKTYSQLCLPLLGRLNAAAKGATLSAPLPETPACAKELAGLYGQSAQVLEELLTIRLHKQERNKTVLILLLVLSYTVFTLISAIAWENHVRKKDVLAARELIEAQTRLKLAIAGARDGIWDWPDSRREAQYWSPQFKNLLGYADDGIEAAATHFFELPQPDDKPAFMQAVSETLHNGKPLDCECRLRRADGRFQWFQIKALANRSEETGITRLSGSITDIEARKMLEVQKSLLIARLEQTNDELEKFAHIVSHDLKEPLRTMASFAGLLAQKYKEGLDEKARSYIGQMQTAAQRMQNLINDLLDYAKLNQNVARRELVDTQSETENVITQLHKSIEEHKARISLSALPKIHTNAARFSSVMQNLLSNAIKYGKADVPPVITISGIDQDAFWRFEVVDNGIGIPSDATSIIFEPFRRLHSAKEYEGTGIGLALCKRMVESLGGQIGVESQEGIGSRFFFTLPK